MAPPRFTCTSAQPLPTGGKWATGTVFGEPKYFSSTLAVQLTGISPVGRSLADHGVGVAGEPLWWVLVACYGVALGFAGVHRAMRGDGWFALVGVPLCLLMLHPVLRWVWAMDWFVGGGCPATVHRYIQPIDTSVNRQTKD